MGNQPSRPYRVVRKKNQPVVEDYDSEIVNQGESIEVNSLGWVVNFTTCCTSTCTLVIVIAFFIYYVLNSSNRNLF